MLNPRWRKVLRDLKGNKVRTLLVIMAIAVAVFTVGVVANTRTSLNREMTRSYLATEPASAVLFTEPFGDDLIQVVEQMPAVAKAEGRRNLATRFKVGTPEETADQAWLDLQLTALPNSTDINIHKIWPEKGDWPPPENEIMLERASLEFIGAEIGQTLTIRLPSGKIRPMRIAGTVHDPAIPSPAITGQASGFINVELLPWLNEQPGFDQLNLIVADRTTDSEYIRQVAETVRNKIEKSGRLVNWIWVPDPGRHPAEQILDPLLLLLGAIGLLSLLLSGFVDGQYRFSSIGPASTTNWRNESHRRLPQPDCWHVSGQCFNIWLISFDHRSAVERSRSLGSHQFYCRPDQPRSSGRRHYVVGSASSSRGWTFNTSPRRLKAGFDQYASDSARSD